MTDDEMGRLVERRAQIFDELVEEYRKRGLDDDGIIQQFLQEGDVQGAEHVRFGLSVGWFS